MVKSTQPADLPPAEEIPTRFGPLLLPRDDNVMLPLIESTGDWELNEALLFQAHIRRASTVVDIGAHVGYYTLLSAHAVGWRGRVVAVEPEPGNAALLRENIRRNRLRNVTVIEAAAWRETTRLHLRRDPVNSGDNRIVRDGSGYDVGAVALDERLARLRVSAVKIDAQGTDHIALEGMRQTIGRCQPVVFAEFWPQAIREFGDDPAKVIDRYRELGFRITVIGFETDFARWTAADIVKATDGFPFGAVALVLRPPEELSRARPSDDSRSGAESC
jgi:FkbM family methyltransferase